MMMMMMMISTCKNMSRTCLDEKCCVAENHEKERQPDHEHDDHVPVDGHHSGFFSAVRFAEILPVPLL
jgi:hypothetical protein